MKKCLQLCIVSICLMFIVMVSCSSSDPQSQLGKIDDLLKKGFPMTTEQTADVNKFVAEGKSLMEKGKDREASESFSKAINVLNMAQDAYIFNKAD